MWEIKLSFLPDNKYISRDSETDYTTGNLVRKQIVNSREFQPQNKLYPFLPVNLNTRWQSYSIPSPLITMALFLFCLMHLNNFAISNIYYWKNACDNRFVFKHRSIMEIRLKYHQCSNFGQLISRLCRHGLTGIVTWNLQSYKKPLFIAQFHFIPVAMS